MNGPGGSRPAPPGEAPGGPPPGERRALKMLPLLGRPSPGDAGRQAAEEQRLFRPELYWYLSFRCNLACAHCSVQSSPQVDTSGDLDTAQALQVIEQMVELNVSRVILTGGEALLRRDALAIIAALGERGIAVSLESNGLLFGEAFAELARRLQARGLLSIGVSLDGGTALTHERMRGPGSFHRTLRGLQFLRANDVAFSVQCILNRSNYQTIPELYRIARELRPALRALGFGFLNPIGRGVELVADLGVRPADMVPILELIRREKRGFEGVTVVKSPPAAIPPPFLEMVFKDPGVANHVSCAFPLLGILPNGDVTICGLSREDEELHYGSVLRDRLLGIWEKARFGMLRGRYLAAEELTGICGDCVFKHSCKGGCRAWAYEEGRSFDAPLPLCAALAEAGQFPRSYRISEQRKALAERLPDVHIGCACH